MQLVHHSGNRLIATSLEISNRFGRQHKNVLQAIENLECSDTFRRLNFQPIVYHDGRNRPQQAFEITRNGFAFLCMGFTGPQAALWKERYIEAFEQMEAALKAPPTPAPVPLLAQEVAGELVRDLHRRVNEQQARLDRLSAQLLAARDREIRALKQKTADEAQRRIDRVILLEAAGTPRAQIVAETGLSFNYVRQILFRARAKGDLPPLAAQGELDLGGVAA